MAKAKTGARMNGNGGAIDPAALLQLEPIRTAGNKMFEAWMAIGNELLELSKAHVDQSVEMGRAMARSSSLGEAMEVQARFARSMMSDFLGKAGRIIDLGSRPIIESAAAMQEVMHGAASRTNAG